MLHLKIKKTLILLSAFLVMFTTVIYSIEASSVNKSAVVLLVAKDSTGKILGTGTGFIVRPEGTLVTNYHVLLDAKTIGKFHGTNAATTPTG